MEPPPPPTTTENHQNPYHHYVSTAFSLHNLDIHNKSMDNEKAALPPLVKFSCPHSDLEDKLSDNKDDGIVVVVLVDDDDDDDCSYYGSVVDASVHDDDNDASITDANPPPSEPDITIISSPKQVIASLTHCQQRPTNDWACKLLSKLNQVNIFTIVMTS